MIESTAADEGLSERVSLFGRVSVAVVGFGLLVHATTTLLLSDPAELLHKGFQVHAATLLPPLGAWLLCRRPRSVLFCRVVESMTLVAYVASLALMIRLVADLNVGIAAQRETLSASAVTQLYAYFSVVLVFAASMAFTVRSALVPSRPRHTALLGLLMGIAMIAVLVAKLPGAGSSREWATPAIAVSTSGLWIIATAVCSTLSAVIHGLRREIAKARKLGQYTLGEKIGEGGMGTVYHASHAMLRRPTAVKLLQDGRITAETLKRFEREVQLTAQLTHPSTITIYDYGRTPDGVFYYAMELLGGASLQTVVDEQGAQPEGRVVHVLRMVSSALAEAHGRGLIHRDIKPANIMLGERGGAADFATVLDFGLVRELEGNTSPELTSAGAVVGTPMYLAPEVIKGSAASAYSDLYALGGVGYFMLTGKTVFDGATVVEVCSQHLYGEVTAPSAMLGKPVHAGLAELLVQCLAKDPNARPRSAADLAEALEALDVPRWKPSAKNSAAA